MHFPTSLPRPAGRGYPFRHGPRHSPASAVDIVVDDRSTPLERNIAKIPGDRLSDKTGMKTAIVSETARPTGAPRILPGIPQGHATITGLFDTLPLTELAPSTPLPPPSTRPLP